MIKKHGRDILDDVNIQSVRVYLYSVSELKPEELQRRYLKKINSPELKANGLFAYGKASLCTRAPSDNR